MLVRKDSGNIFNLLIFFLNNILIKLIIEGENVLNVKIIIITLVEIVWIVQDDRIFLYIKKRNFILLFLFLSFLVLYFNTFYLIVKDIFWEFLSLLFVWLYLPLLYWEWDLPVVMELSKFYYFGVKLFLLFLKLSIYFLKYFIINSFLQYLVLTIFIFVDCHGQEVSRFSRTV